MGDSRKYTIGGFWNSEDKGGGGGLKVDKFLVGKSFAMKANLPFTKI